MRGPGSTLNRRAALVLTGGVTAGTALGLVAPTTGLAQKAAKAAVRASEAAAGTGAPGLRFFSPSELQMLDELAEAIIPADDSSGGAKAAKVADAIDLKLGESLDSNMRQSWRDDLAEINRIAGGMFGRPFVRLSPSERERLLGRISRNESNPREPGEFAFGTIKWEVALHYYKSKIGIHDELKYQGNVLQDEFAGTDVSKS